MDLRRELLLTLGVLVSLNLLLSFGAIGLFQRMSPAIERILKENVYSIAAAQEILAALAVSDETTDRAASRQRINAALSRAKENVTEAAETPLLEAIDRHAESALAGNAEARAQVVGAVLELIRVNREAMGSADQSARRLGSAGAWGAVFVGFTSFALSLLVAMRFRRRLLEPLVELDQVLRAARGGDVLRRCRQRTAPLELQQVRAAVNQLLDERLAHQEQRV